MWDKLKSLFSNEDPNQVDWSKVKEQSLASARGEKVPGIATLGVGNDYTSNDVQNNATAQTVIDNNKADSTLQDISQEKEEEPSGAIDFAEGLGKAYAKGMAPGRAFQAEAPTISSPQDIMKAKREALMSMFRRSQ